MYNTTVFIQYKQHTGHNTFKDSKSLKFAKPMLLESWIYNFNSITFEQHTIIMVKQNILQIYQAIE